MHRPRVLAAGGQAAGVPHLDLPVLAGGRGKRFFELANGLREQRTGKKRGLVYSRINNPNLQMFGERMAAWDRTEMGATFATGMAAISTSLLAFEVEGGEAAAFKVLDRSEVFRLAVSLGGTAGMIRMSVGIEHMSDLKRDLNHALGR